MARVIIADAGPLIALSGIDALATLRGLFSEVHIAETVMQECVAKPGQDSQRIETAIEEGWLVTFTPEVHDTPFSPALGAGESDSIRFALQSADESLLIVDDRLARRYALKLGINIVGTVRLLDLAEQRGLIESAVKSIAAMADIGYRVSPDLLERIRSERLGSG